MEGFFVYKATLLFHIRKNLLIFLVISPKSTIFVTNYYSSAILS